MFLRSKFNNSLVQAIVKGVAIGIRQDILQGSEGLMDQQFRKIPLSRFQHFNNIMFQNQANEMLDQEKVLKFNTKKMAIKQYQPFIFRKMREVDHIEDSEFLVSLMD